MLQSILNGGDTSNRSRQVVAVLLAAALMVTGVTATVAAQDGYRSLHSDDFSSFDSSVWTTSGVASHDSANDRVTISGSGRGALEYDSGVPDSESWRTTIQHSTGGGETGFAIQMFTDSVTKTESTSGISVVASGNQDKVMIKNASSWTTLASSSAPIDTANEITVSYDSGSVTVSVGGSAVVTHNLSTTPSGTGLGVRSWGGSNNVVNRVDGMSVSVETEDSDGDGTLDHQDPYPDNAPTNYTLTPGDGTVSSAYIEASGGLADVTLYGVDNGSETKLTSTSVSTGDTTQLTEVDATRGFDSYRMQIHGNATISDSGLLYEATGSGGVSEETYQSGIDSVLSDLGSLSDGLSSGIQDVQRGQMMLGGLILAVGLVLFVRD